MGDLSEHFSAREFQCRGTGCCENSHPVSMDLVAALEALRHEVNEEIQTNEAVGLHINSGFRCRRHNRAIGGSPASRHTLGLAADVRSPRFLTPAVMARLAEKVPALCAGGIGVYEWGIHVDVDNRGDSKPRRWAYRGNEMIAYDDGLALYGGATVKGA